MTTDIDINPLKIPVIAAFIVIKNPMTINKNEMINLLGEISYDDIEYQCIKADDLFLVGFCISGFNKLPGSDLATIDIQNAANDINFDNESYLLSKVGKEVQRIYINRSMV